MLSKVLSHCIYSSGKTLPVVKILEIDEKYLFSESVRQRPEYRGQIETGLIPRECDILCL